MSASNNRVAAACDRALAYSRANGPRAGVAHLVGGVVAALQEAQADPDTWHIVETLDRMLRPWAYPEPGPEAPGSPPTPVMGGPGYTCAMCGGTHGGDRVHHSPGCSAGGAT